MSANVDLILVAIEVTSVDGPYGGPPSGPWYDSFQLIDHVAAFSSLIQGVCTRRACSSS